MSNFCTLRSQWPNDCSCELSGAASKLDCPVRLEEGCIVYGLFMDGARWCNDKQVIQDSLPKASEQRKRHREGEAERERERLRFL